MKYQFTPFQIALGNRRLNKLADRLSVVDKARASAGLPGYCQRVFQHFPCGTPACALGQYVEVAPRWSMSNIRRIPLLAKFSTDSPALDAIKEFSLTSQDYSGIFGDHGCNNASSGKEAARYIRRFVYNRKRRLARQLTRRVRRSA